MSAADGDGRDAEELVCWLARWLAETAEDGSGELSGEELAAYREGRAEPDVAAEIEARLAADPGARERLAALAGLRLPEPSRATRDAVLAGFAGARHGVPRKRPARRILGWLAAAAALLAVALATWRLADRFARPAVPSYQATIAGLADNRAAPVSGTTARALPETVIRIEALPRDAAVPGIELALYRQSGRGLERISETTLRRLPAGRGAAVFEARAADLVGTVPGKHLLFLAAAPDGGLPRLLEQAQNERSGRRLIPLEIEILASVR